MFAIIPVTIFFALLLNGAKELVAMRTAQRKKEAYQFSYARVFWSKFSAWALIIIGLVLLARLYPVVWQNIQVRQQPYWTEYEQIYHNPPDLTNICPSGQLPSDWDEALKVIESQGTSEQVAWGQALDTKKEMLKALYPHFHTGWARFVGMAIKFLPLISWFATILLTSYLFRVIGRGKKEAMGGIQIILLVFVFFVLCGSRLADALPAWLSMSYGFLAKMYGFETPKMQAFFALIVAMVAMAVRIGSGSRGLAVLTYLALVLAGVNLVGFVAPSFMAKKRGDEWGSTYNNPLTLATVQEENVVYQPLRVQGATPGTQVKSYLISFDTRQPGPHPTGIKVHHLQRGQFERATELEKSYQYLRTRTGKKYWASAAGDSLNGQSLMPHHFRHMEWFHTLSAPAGAIIVQIGSGNWFAPFQNGDMFTGTGVDGEVWVDINDTQRRPEKDGLQYYVDNEGIAYLRLRVYEPPGKALLAGS